MHDLEGRGWTLRGVTSDTALAAVSGAPRATQLSPSTTSLRYLRRELRRIPQNSNNFHCSMTPKASTTRRCRR